MVKNGVRAIVISLGLLGSSICILTAAPTAQDKMQDKNDKMSDDKMSHEGKMADDKMAKEKKHKKAKSGDKMDHDKMSDTKPQ